MRPPDQYGKGMHYCTTRGVNHTQPIRRWLSVLVGLMVAAQGLGPSWADAGQAGPPQAAWEQDCLVTQLPVDPRPETSASSSGGMLRIDYGEGSRIVGLYPRQGVARVLTAAFHSACEPDVSFDGKRFLFAGKRTAAAPWQIYEMGVDGSAVRQVTQGVGVGVGDCRSPGYQSTQYVITADEPWYQITFVRIDRGSRNEIGTGPVSSLYSCKPDGSEVRRLTYNLSSDFDPAILWDGRLVFASWRRCGFEHGVLGRIGLFAVATDGVDSGAFSGEGGKRIKHMPCATAAGLLVFVEGDRVPWDGAGTLASVGLRRPLHSYRAITTEADGLFHSPSPLPDGRILVSRRPADGSGNHAVCRLDPASKRLELVYDDPGFHDVQAKVIHPRSEPDGHASNIVEEDPFGKFYCLDVYSSDLKDRGWLAPGKAKKVRLLEGIPLRAEEAIGPGHAPQLALRRILGEAPIVEDRDGRGAFVAGAFSLQVPANTPIQLQILDEQGMALRSCGWIWARSRHTQGCIGCHEDQELTPVNWQSTAVTKKAVSLCPPPQQRVTVDFRRDVMPIVVRKCAGCHASGGSPPDLSAAGGADAGLDDDRSRSVYETLLAAQGEGKPREGYGKYVHPGRARTSPLVWHLLGRNTSSPWDGASAKLPVKPISPAPSSAGQSPGPSEAPSERENEVFVTWIDLGAPWGRVGGAGGLPAPAGGGDRRGR